jgi:malonyl-CoA decarboxylase
MRRGFVRTVIDSIADAGRDLLERRPSRRGSGIAELSEDLLTQKGEASGTALAREVLDAYRALDADGRCAFFGHLEAEMAPDPDAVQAALDAYRASPDHHTLVALGKAAEPRRQELIRRMNMAPGGTGALVAMREELLGLLCAHPRLRAVDSDFQHLFASWFNRGFLVMQRIDWQSPAHVLEKLIEYEAVHAVQGWPDLRRRLEADRRCFAFFHPALVDEPLIFVEVALVNDIAAQVQPLLDVDGTPQDPDAADTAIFYSISNCQAGLKGVSFGNFLIKQVAAELKEELPRLKTFATLSPIPGFRRWLARTASGGGDEADAALAARARQAEERMAGGWAPEGGAGGEALEKPLKSLCAHYLLRAKTAGGAPLDPVARFHLGNGARLERVNWCGDTSHKGVEESAGMMVNYLYDMPTVERNHEAYVNDGTVIASNQVKGLVG